MNMIPCFNCNPRGALGGGDPGCAYCSGVGRIQTDPETAAAVNAGLLQRWPIAIAAYDAGLAVLANDGTLWRTTAMNPTGWAPMPQLPQPDDGERVRIEGLEANAWDPKA